MSTLSLLNNVHVYFAGLPTKEYAKAVRVLKYLGGTHYESLPDLRHLNEESLSKCVVVNSVGINDFTVAKREGLPIVSLEWLFDCYRQRQSLSLDRFFVKCFHGLQITCTHISQAERIRIQKMVEDNGGIYNCNLVRHQCTHLIAKDTSGDKYMHAKMWKTVKIVSVDWIDKCLEINEWVPEYEFLILPMKLKGELVPTISNESKLSNPKCIQTIQSLQETILLSHKWKFVDIIDSYIYELLESSSMSCMPNPQDIPLEKYDSFANEIFFIHGFSSKLTNYATQLILMTGGMRTMIPIQSMTKVLIPMEMNTNDELRRLRIDIERNQTCKSNEINFVWLVERVFGFSVILKIIESHSLLNKLPFEYNSMNSMKDLIDQIESYQLDHVINCQEKEYLNEIETKKRKNSLITYNSLTAPTMMKTDFGFKVPKKRVFGLQNETDEPSVEMMMERLPVGMIVPPDTTEHIDNKENVLIDVNANLIPHPMDGQKDGKDVLRIENNLFKVPRTEKIKRKEENKKNDQRRIEPKGRSFGQQVESQIVLFEDKLNEFI